jgi:hypothetical protein
MIIVKCGKCNKEFLIDKYQRQYWEYKHGQRNNFYCELHRIKTNQRKFNHKEIISLYNSTDKTPSDIAKDLDASEGQIRYILRINKVSKYLDSTWTRSKTFKNKKYNMEIVLKNLYNMEVSI